MNPDREVKTEKFSRTEGKTPAFDAEQVQKVLDTIDTSNEVGLRDRALLSKAPTGSLQRQHRREPVRFEVITWPPLADVAHGFKCAVECAIARIDLALVELRAPPVRLDYGVAAHHCLAAFFNRCKPSCPVCC
jgi:hypothetical protein